MLLPERALTYQTQMRDIYESQAYRQKKRMHVIFRVYGLDTNSIDVKVYVDPMRAKDEGRLEFERTDQNWRVTPWTLWNQPIQRSSHSKPVPTDGEVKFKFGETATAFGRSLSPS